MLLTGSRRDISPECLSILTIGDPIANDSTSAANNFGGLKYHYFVIDICNK